MNVNYYGGFGISYGYGSATEQLAIALNEAGIDIRVMRAVNEKLEVRSEDITEKGKQLLKKPFIKSDTAICFGHPPFFDKIVGYKNRIGYTMFESDKLPDATNKNPCWIKQCNKMTRLWVPSQSSKELFEKSGVTIPIDVVRNGVDSDLFPYIQRPYRDTFTFLMYGVLTIRKNPGHVISAFLSLFKDNPKVHLVLKTQSGTLGHIKFKDENITIIDKKYSHKEMIELLQGSDAFVFPSRGEGFGLPPLEAMSTGLPTIFSHNSGMKEYSNKMYNFPINCPEKKKTTHIPKHWGDIGYWWEPDYEELKNTMLWIYNNQEKSKQIASNCSKWVQKEFSWKKAGEYGAHILKNL